MSREIHFDITPHISPTDKVLSGMPLEVEGFDNPTYARWKKGMELMWSKRAKITVEGALPTQGSALFVATHTGTESTAILPWLTTELINRPIQVVAKDTLLYPELEESQKVTERTGKNGSQKISLKDKFFSKASIAANSIPIERGEPNLDRLKDIGEILKSGHLVGWFLQETRTKEDDLTTPMEGAALLSRMNQDVPIVLVAMSNTKLLGSNDRPSRTPSIRVRNIGSYKDMANGSRLDRATLTEKYVDNIAEMLLKDIPSVRLPGGRIQYQPGTEIVDFTKKDK